MKVTVVAILCLMTSVALLAQDDSVEARLQAADGWSVQASYYVIFDKLQLVERLEVFDPSDLEGVAGTRSLVSGLNWYFKQHDVKLQLGWMRTSVPGLANKESKLIARLQTVF